MSGAATFVVHNCRGVYVQFIVELMQAEMLLKFK